MNQGSSKQQLRAQLRETVQVAILDAAEELIADRGLHAAPLAQIARRAGVAVGTLYNYFADREAMIVALFENRRAQLRPALRTAIAAGRDLAFEPRLRQFVHDVLRVFEIHRRFIKVVIETEHLRLKSSTTGQDLGKGVEEVVEAGVIEGVIDRGRAELFALTVIAALKGIVLRRISDGAPLLPDAVPLIELLLDGARSR
ncbi:MAG: TetR family transcriptional regulator [Myxococcales bacterium]|nr:TetR family transcriptional regulator [Myxococcales bacterium]